MSDKGDIKFFYLPLNKNIILGFISVFILISLGTIRFDSGSELTEEVIVKGNDKSYYQIPSDKQEMALTINVAWGEEYIPQILDILDNYDVKASFFFVGNWVEKFPELLKEIDERGHELGNHGYRHKHPKQLSEEELIALIKKNEELIEKMTGYKTELFAPPYGEVDDKIVEIAAEIDYKTIMWSADTIDWQRPAPEVIVNRVLNKKQKGGIILMHPTEPTTIALPEIIKKLEAKGYKLGTISQLLE